MLSPEFLAYEAFIRRAAMLNLPFMLKGSYVTRQYFRNPTDRRPLDLDWVYLTPITSGEQAQAVFDDWATRVTELPADDGVVFRSFRENAFWRNIEYALTEGFPTINTDIRCWVLGQELDLTMDVSFNLPIDVPAEPLYYQPAQGEPFIVEQATPLSLQVAWKLHQSLLRPRFKDLFDLQHLLCHPDFMPATLLQALEALREECRLDGTSYGRLRWLVLGPLNLLFDKEEELAIAWQTWRYGRPEDQWTGRYSDEARTYTTAARLPATLPEFEQQLRAVFRQAGLAEAVVPLPPPLPTRHRKELSPARQDFIDQLKYFWSKGMD